MVEIRLNSTIASKKISIRRKHTRDFCMIKSVRLPIDKILVMLILS